MSDTVTGTLTDFLLARIAEDEAAVHSLAEHGGMTGYPGRCRESRGAEGWDWLDTSDWDDGYRLATTADRVLAECEAKRRIIERATEQLPMPPNDTDYLLGVAAGVHMTLYWLALPYADHPDYREEWRG